MPIFHVNEICLVSSNFIQMNHGLPCYVCYFVTPFMNKLIFFLLLALFVFPDRDVDFACQAGR